MNAFEVTAWRCDNPLHVLAALGTLALTDDATPGQATLSWAQSGGIWCPVFGTPLAAGEWVACLSNAVVAAGSTSTDAARKRELQSAVKLSKKVSANSRDELKRARRAAEEHAKVAVTTVPPELASRSKRDQDAWRKEQQRAVVQNEVRPFEQRLQEEERSWKVAQEALADELGDGPAHLGEIIGVTPGIFRGKALNVLGAWRDHRVSVRQYAGLGSDACLDKEGRISPTPLSFSNGASEQRLLKDFRSLAQHCSVAVLDALLVQGAPLLATKKGITSLNWDPQDNRSYALMWGDPGDQKNKGAVDVGTNALAYLGLGLLTAVPRLAGLTALGFHGGRGSQTTKAPSAIHGWSWPIWPCALGISVVQSLLATVSGGDDMQRLQPRGVVAVFTAERINPNGQRVFFAPARRR